MLQVVATVEMQGLQTARRNLGAPLERLLETHARNVERRAKELAAVDTGTMRRSIQVIHLSEFTWLVVVGVFYGIYVEFGTSRMVAQPFLIPALEAERKPLIEDIRDLMAA